MNHSLDPTEDRGLRAVEPEDDPRVLQVSREYLAELETGQFPDRDGYLARYPELATVIAECLDGVELAHALNQGQPPPATGPAEFATHPLGDFKILRELGRGGMGTVYEAVQLSLGRRVALKVLPFAAALDERQRQRFQLEAQAAAQLHHPHIVPVYAVGCDRGTHYYAMQLINGQPLSNWIAATRSPTRDASGRDSSEAAPAKSVLATATRDEEASGTLVHSQGTEAASTWFSQGADRKRFRAAATLAAQVADALEYAHATGIVHRDIKPANLLIDVVGNAWVTDFGLAQIAATASMTRTGDLLGTLRYMSPEQASGRRLILDHRCDIYALGATLYELLALRPMFPGQDRQTILQAILTEEPAPLRKLDRAIPVELETIVMKATAKSPHDRYASAAEFAADLRNYLNERPIQARRPTVIDHARKWMRRHPTVVAATLVILLCGIVGLSLAVAAVSHEKANTQEALRNERQRAAEAETRLRLAQRAADDMIALAEFELAESPRTAALRKKLLESALGHYQAFVNEQSDNPAAASELAATRDRVQKIVDDLLLLASERDSSLLHHPDVLADLQIDEQQYDALREWFRQSARREPPARTFEERKEQQLDRARRSREALTRILTEDQQARLTQLNLQFQGVRAFHESEVITALELTDQQRMRIHEIESQANFARQGRRFPDPPLLAGLGWGAMRGGRGRGGRMGPGGRGGPGPPPPPPDAPPLGEEPPSDGPRGQGPPEGRPRATNRLGNWRKPTRIRKPCKHVWKSSPPNSGNVGPS